jgi:hypothetical protein
VDGVRELESSPTLGLAPRSSHHGHKARVRREACRVESADQVETGGACIASYRTASWDENASTGHKAHTPAGFWYGTNSHPSPLSSIILWGSQWPASWTANDVTHTETQHPAGRGRYAHTHPSCRDGPSQAQSARRSGSGLTAAGLALPLPTWAAALLGPESVNTTQANRTKQGWRTKLNPPSPSLSQVNDSPMRSLPPERRVAKSLQYESDQEQQQQQQQQHHHHRSAVTTFVSGSRIS